jgi:hypothetical protein
MNAIEFLSNLRQSTTDIRKQQLIELIRDAVNTTALVNTTQRRTIANVIQETLQHKSPVISAAIDIATYINTCH